MRLSFDILKDGNILLFPTDTLYGLGVDATNPKAVLRLRSLKGRDDKKPISIMVSDMAMAEKYAVVTPLARKLADKFFPGALTLVLFRRKFPRGNFRLQDVGEQHKNVLADEIGAGTGTVGIRIPDHPTALQLVREFGKPITATSANVADMPPARSPEKILAQFGKRADLIYQIINAGELPESLPSTVVDARSKVPVVLRSGVIADGEIIN